MTEDRRQHMDGRRRVYRRATHASNQATSYTGVERRIADRRVCAGRRAVR